MLGLIPDPVPCMNYFYFDKTNQQHGPIDDQQLKELAERGIITPNTRMQTVDGHKGIAKQIPGLTFGAVRSAAPEWYAMASIVCGLICVGSIAVRFAWEFGLFRPETAGSSGYMAFLLVQGLWLFSDIVFVAGMFWGCRGLSTNKATTAMIGTLLCVIAFSLPRLHGCWRLVLFAVGGFQ